MISTRKDNGRRVIENWDTVFRALSAEPRRQIALSLNDAAADESVPLPESAVNPNVPPDPESLRQELHHTHLPMLEEMGFVERETEPLAAARGPQFEQVAAVLDALLANASDIPDSLVVGCQRLEAEQQESIDL